VNSDDQRVSVRSTADAMKHAGLKTKGIVQGGSGTDPMPRHELYPFVLAHKAIAGAADRGLERRSGVGLTRLRPFEQHDNRLA
jgi:hypothetical protein